MCWLFLAAGPASAPAQAAEGGAKRLQGSWSATTAHRDGRTAVDVVGHRLSFSGERFQILSSDGRLLHAGVARADSSVTPAAIDFEHTEGPLQGKVWRGIYVLKDDTLTICDNAPDPAGPRPTSFEAASGSGRVLITFARVKP